MKQGLLLLQWSPPLHTPSTLKTRLSSITPIASTPSLESTSSLLSGRERRQLRQERRESRAGEEGNWREEVEERLLYKPKKKKVSWTEDLNLDKLALLGTQWWVVRVSRVTGQETSERIAKALIRNYPNFEFKVYFPTVPERRKLKNGSCSTKMKPHFPGCIFLQCVLNKEMHDFIRECDGVGGFLGSKVGNTKRQINRPKPVPLDEMETIFREVKEAQEKHDQALKEEPQEEKTNSSTDSLDAVESTGDAKPKRRSKKGSEPLRGGRSTGKALAPGARVRVLSGPFTEFTGQLKELDHKRGKATVGFVLFGKESYAELGIDQIVMETA